MRLLRILSKKIYFYKLFYKGVFCRSMIMTLIVLILAFGSPFLELVQILSYIYLYFGLLCDFLYRRYFSESDSYFYKNGSCSMVELNVVSFVCSYVFVSLLSYIAVYLYENVFRG